MQSEKELPPSYEEATKSPNAPPFDPHGACSSGGHPGALPYPQPMCAVQPAPFATSSYASMPQSMLVQGPQPGGQPITLSHAGPLLNQPAAVTVIPTGPESIFMTCPFCSARINTETKRFPSINAFLSAALILLCGFWCGCCLVPFCISSCYNTRHSCPSCKNFLTMYRP